MLKLQLEMQLGYHLKKKPDFVMGFSNENDLHKKKKKNAEEKKLWKLKKKNFWINKQSNLKGKVKYMPYVDISNYL